MSSIVTYLPRVFGGGAMRKDEYVFQDGEVTPADLPIQEWVRRCQLAHADVEIEKAGLAEAQNQVVQCQARLAKAELLLERQQDEFTRAASKLPGVPCLRS